MSLIQLVITLLVVGVALWVFNNYISMDATIKKILNVAVVLVVILWLVRLFGLLGSMSEPLIQLVIALLVVGVGLWLTNDYIPMDATIKKILNVVLVIVLIFWLLSIFGLLGSVSQIRIGR